MTMMTRRRRKRRVVGGAFLKDEEIRVGKVSTTRETSVDMYDNTFTLQYTVPRAFLFRNPQPSRVGTFAKKGGELVNIKIGDKYIQFFIRISDTKQKYKEKFYAMMRLPIYVLIKGLLASSFNSGMFYELNSAISIDPDSQEVVFGCDEKSDCIREEKKKTKSWGIFASRDVNTTIHIDPKYCREVSKDTEIFDVLNRFRREQVLKIKAKEEGTRIAMKMVGDALLKNV